MKTRKSSSQLGVLHIKKKNNMTIIISSLKRRRSYARKVRGKSNQYIQLRKSEGGRSPYKFECVRDMYRICACVCRDGEGDQGRREVRE